MRSSLLMKMNFPVLGELDIEVSDQKFGEFIHRQFYVYVSNVDIVEYVRKEVKIILKNPYIANIFEEILKGNIASYARRIVVKDGKLYLNNIVFRINERKMLIIETRNSFQKFERAIAEIKNVYFNVKNYSKRKKYAVYHLNFYSQILFPVFLIYSLFGYYLVHGSLLKHNDKCILLTGLDGVGKSSIANELYKNGWKVCADNFVLFNGENAVPFKLAMRLEAQQETRQKVLFQMKGMKEVIDTMLDNSSIVSPQAIFILTIGREYFVKEVSCREVYWVSYMNNAPEIAAANAFIAPMLYENICKNDKKSIDLDIPMYVMEIPKGELKRGARNIEFIV